MEAEYPTERRVPPRALLLSLVALVIPVVGAFVVPEDLADYGALLWLLALLPAFLLAYYRGWRGVATALAAGMATLSFTQAVASWLDHSIPDLLLGVVMAYLGISLGIGWLAELLHHDRDEVESLAFTDNLTRLPNRRHARVFLENEFAAAERGRLLSVVLFDLDDFKTYNDRYGHAAGDEALVAFAEILAQTTRRMNLAARFGGEEFLAVLAGTDSEGGMIFGDRVRMALKHRNLSHGPLTVSGGVASYHPSMRSPDELLAAADHALYEAKREGRDRIRLFGRTLLDRTLLPDETLSSEELQAAAETAGEYPRSDDEIGRSRPPVTLLPHQITEFGSNRRLLLVEDEESVRELIAGYLEKEAFEVAEAVDVGAAIRHLGTDFDVVVTDIRLPGASGTELISAVKSRWPATQVVVITGVREAKVAAEALAAGADRYLFKPFGMTELRAHLVDALARRDRALAIRAGQRPETPEAAERARQSREAVLEGARSLVRGVEVRVPYLEGHGDRVGRYAAELARLADPDGERIDREALVEAARLIDVGMIGVPAGLLVTGTRLSPGEWRQIRQHPRHGRRILDALLDDPGILDAVTWHHERWDGAGYPDGLSGEAIPLPARVLALSDAVDAMACERPYRERLAWEEVLEEVRRASGGQFDPELGQAFREAADEMEAIHRGPG